MPKREGRILEVMELRRLQVEVARLRTLAIVVTDQSPSLGIAFAAAFDAFARECDAVLRKMMDWWSPQCSLSSTRRTVDSFTDDELRSWFRFDREAISELQGLLGVPNVLRSRCKRQFDGEKGSFFSFVGWLDANVTWSLRRYMVVLRRQFRRCTT